MVLRAGTGKAEFIFPNHFLPTEGFVRQAGTLYARVLLLEQEERIAVLTVDMTSLPEEAVDHLAEILEEKTGVRKQHCWISVTHTFSVPHILPDKALVNEEARTKQEQLKKVLYDAAGRAAEQAAGLLQEAVLKIGQAGCAVNANRDFETPQGWWIGNDAGGPSDKTVTVLQFENKAGERIALWFHYAVQSSILDASELREGGKAVSSDLAGAACLRLEQAHPGITALFGLGAAGDQMPVKKARTVRIGATGMLEETDAQDDAIAWCTELGSRLAEAAEAAMLKAVKAEAGKLRLIRENCRLPAQQMPRSIHRLKPTRSWNYETDGEREVETAVLRIGQLALVGVKPELNTKTAEKIAAQSPFKITLLYTMVNGGAKYMADESSYDRFTYEARNSPFAKGAAELYTRQIAGLLQRIIKED